ncbi:MAG TPA: CRISPR-associated helicase Cas3' [Candidatus Wujingus californicus]|uniref:CRISPR-associated helicase Cas3' n=1 Tax=Candidatus Wujingus californicus TaxID=3367618 RepID=UPI001D34F08C|nr:CRISPR-associated helicase Cas3' [Planctomycetota bacterium]MDO8094732.1 CRISPR-associated helicase Cas3' [Candidatus Brocadiales bacterium]
MKELYAHSANSHGQRHRLSDHLKEVAALSKKFADKFGAGKLAYWVGLWHDLGKANPEFQEYLQRCINEPDRLHRGPDHKGAGAVLAYKHIEPLAFPVVGHHGGLMNFSDLKTWISEKNTSSHIQTIVQELTNQGFNLSPSTALTQPSFIKDEFNAEFFIRMLFSALVDADFLDTEDHFTPDNKAKRGNFPSLSELWQRFESDQNKITGKSKDQLNIIRNNVYLDCIKAAELPLGFFRLTVPTGGGKTRSGMAFGIRHAITHEMNRVIFAIPYTSIIEQTADVYRDIFGKEAVLEHHSAVTYDDESDNVDDGTSWARLAAQNWDAPIIVTTTVQLFESLLSNKTSKCRKLHNIANSVIILDEVQTLPTKLLAPILDVLRQLVDHYGVSVVFCTATQPALEDSPYLKGIKNIREIVKKPANLFYAMKRVDYQRPIKDEKWDWQRVAEEMGQSFQCLAIVNTKDDAMSLLNAIDDPSALHLSTLLCGAHRRDVLSKVRKLLDADKPCRLVSTQVVEAGVDLDFPLVLRAIGPFDRIVQAAGRCNRNGKMRERGRVVVFNPVDAKIPSGDYRTGTETAFSLMNLEGFDFHDPKIYETYFKRLYQVVNTDAKRIQESRNNFNYKDVDDKFNMIDDASTSVIVRYKGLDNEKNEVDKILSSIKYMPPTVAFRKLQPYLVNIKQYKFRQFQLDGLVIEISEGRYEWCGAYDNVRGLMATGRNPEDFVV